MRTTEKFSRPPPSNDEKKASPWLADKYSLSAAIAETFTPGTGIRERNL